MFPMALITGNTMVVKPSERDPGACMFLMNLINEAGFPKGTVNVIHGAHAGRVILCKLTDENMSKTVCELLNLDLHAMCLSNKKITFYCLILSSI